MAETTGIAYVHHSRNFWTGCTKVGPGCDGCYAEAFQRWIRGKDPETGEAKNWGPGRARVPHLEGAAKDLRRWNRKAAAAGERRRVFINTQSDTFDNEAPQEWREFMWPVLVECTWLDILLVTKRVGNVHRMVPIWWMGYGSFAVRGPQWPDNIRVLATIVNQEEADRDISKLLELPCKNGVSYEPALGPVNWAPHMPRTPDRQKGTEWDSVGIQWLIVGGESDQAGHQTRPFFLDWAHNAIEQGHAAGVPVFLKQLGSQPVRFVPEADYGGGVLHEEHYDMIELKAEGGKDPAEWDPELRVQEVPA